jgi:peptidoglycan/xylan/chitin deacetylase (PgdA/CDA1 family)
MSASILTLMYHQISDVAHPQRIQQFEAHLAYLAQNFPIITPQDPLPKKGIAICLTFDDAYYDFYASVYPLLQAYQVKAILAVPVKYILNHTELDPQTRLQVPYPQGMQQNLYWSQVPFCTWQELQQMADSPWVEIASHSHSHPALDQPQINLVKEIIQSKQVLTEKLKQRIPYFVYPYGKFTRQLHQDVIAHYDYAFRIGSALNRGWDKNRAMLYRVDADPIWKNQLPITQGWINQLTCKYWLNRLRFK